MRVALAPLILVIVITGFPGNALATHGAANQLLYVVTDSYDELFARDLLEKYPGLAGTIIGLDDLMDMSGDSLEGGIVVLLDPNWDNSLQVMGALETLREHLYGGGLVVSTLNGALLLYRLLEEHGVVVRIDESWAATSPALPGYDYGKYKVAVLEGANVETVSLLGEVSLYKVSVGNGFVVILPFNIVWAYGDLGEEAYLSLLPSILGYAESLTPQRPSGTARLAPVLMVSTIAAAGYLTLTLSPDDARRPLVAPLRIRVAERHALRHPLRRRIVEVLSQRGYSHFNELWRDLRTSKATLSWHLDVLYRAGIVGYVRYKKYMLYYIATPSSLRALIDDLALRDPDICLILQLLEEGLDTSRISERLGLSVETVNSVTQLLLKYKPKSCAGQGR